MPQAEIIPPQIPRCPSFRLQWIGNPNWKERVQVFLKWFRIFLQKKYGIHWYFVDYEDVALSGTFQEKEATQKLFGVIHCWFLIQNQIQEDKMISDWDEFVIQQQEIDQEGAILLLCPIQHTWIWKFNPGQVIVPDGIKIKPIENYPPKYKWYRAGVYDTNVQDYFFLDNWKTTYTEWLSSK